MVDAGCILIYMIVFFCANFGFCDAHGRVCLFVFVRLKTIADFTWCSLCQR